MARSNLSRSTMQDSTKTIKRAAPPPDAGIDSPAKRPKHMNTSAASHQHHDTAEPGEASTRALGIHEILENILLKLLTKDLFVLQRVNSMWKDVIHRSVPVQKKMFLLADGEVLKPGADVQLSSTKSLRINPILQLVCEGGCSGTKASRLWQERRLRASCNAFARQQVKFQHHDLRPAQQRCSFGSRHVRHAASNINCRSMVRSGLRCGTYQHEALLQGHHPRRCYR